MVSDQSLDCVVDHVVFTVYEKILCEMDLRGFLRERRSVTTPTTDMDEVYLTPIHAKC